jgi:L-galactose dehydrogenase
VEYRAFGNTGLTVSALSFGASALGGVFRDVDEGDAIRSVHAALDAGITYFDVAPSYGATRSEAILGKALSGVVRDRYVLSTKVGKYSKSDESPDFDYSAARIRAELDESVARLGTDRFDILYIHDIEYEAATLRLV